MIKHKSFLLPFLLLLAMLVGQQRVAIVEQAVAVAVMAAADDGDGTLIALSPAQEEDAAFPAWDDGDDASTADDRAGFPLLRAALTTGLEVAGFSPPVAAGYWATAPPRKS